MAGRFYCEIGVGMAVVFHNYTSSSYGSTKTRVDGNSDTGYNHYLTPLPDTSSYTSARNRRIYIATSYDGTTPDIAFASNFGYPVTATVYYGMAADRKAQLSSWTINNPSTWTNLYFDHVQDRASLSNSYDLFIKLTPTYNEPAVYSTLSFDANDGADVDPITQRQGTTTKLWGTTKGNSGTKNKAWTTYTVTLDSRDGSAVPNQTATSYHNYYETYTFSYWRIGSKNYPSGSTYTFGSSDQTAYAYYSTDTVDQGETRVSSVTLPTPTREGYNFLGWYTAASGGSKVNTTYTPSSDITLYAHWQLITYTLLFNSNGGASVDSISQAPNTTTSMPYTTKSNSGTKNRVWTTRVLSFDSQDGSAIASKTANVYHNYHEAYTFNYWLIGSTRYYYNDTYTFTTSNQTANAYYTTNDVDEGETSVDSLTLPTPTRDGYRFLGWYSAASGGTKINSPYAPDSTKTIYAHWENLEPLTTYTLSFNGNGGTPVPQTVSDGNRLGYLDVYISDTPPTKSGNRFLGWSDGSSVIQPNTIYRLYKANPTITLTAQWKPLIAKFYWYSSATDTTHIAVGKPIPNIKATTWKAMTDKIRLLQSYLGRTQSTFSTPQKGEQITAVLFNQVRNSIAELPSGQNVTSTKLKGQEIKAGFFVNLESLRDSLNNAIDDYNNN